MSMDIKSIIIYIMAVILVIVGYIGFNAYREEILSKTITDALQKYFENNNDHIAAHDFSINDIEIRCRGNNAYIVDFNLFLNDKTSNEPIKLGAIINKRDDIWYVKGFGKGLTTDELKTYNFRCYN